MERGSDKHGRILDEALSSEVDLEAEDAPEQALPAPGVPEGMTPEDVEARAAFAGWLGKEIWPTDARTVLDLLVLEGAPDEVLELVRRLPEDRRYDGASQMWAELTGAHEQHRF